MPDIVPPSTTVIEPPPAEPTDYVPEKETKE